ncbi:MAG TPA: hypothetical protein VMG09_16565 [Bacteroidota bacterium]|nr:hypothetical protein [Bacteroidota bacterium]
MNRWYSNMDVLLAIGMLALSVSIVIERYIPHGDLSDFFQGVLVGISIVANVIAIYRMSFRTRRL